MGLFRRSHDNTNKPPRDGPKEWAAKAQEMDAEVKRQRAAERLGDKAVGSHPEKQTPPAEQQEKQNGFTDVEELSEDYLRFLHARGADRGKFIRVGNIIFISPGKIRSHAGEGLMHKEILVHAMHKDGVRERLLGAEALQQGAGEPTIGHDAPEGLVDAGKFDIFFLPEDKPREDGIKARFRVFGSSASFGMAEQEGRDKTVEIAAEALGSHIRVEDAPHMLFS